jgi:predicted nucleotidyltransferase
MGKAVTRSRRIPMRTIRSLSRQIAEQFEPHKIILFGSYAHGAPSPESDVDLLVLMDSQLRNREQAAQIARALRYNFGLDLLVRSPEQFEQRIALGDYFLRDIAKRGKVLYERADT